MRGKARERGGREASTRVVPAVRASCAAPLIPSSIGKIKEQFNHHPKSQYQLGTLIFSYLSLGGCRTLRFSGCGFFFTPPRSFPQEAGASDFPERRRVYPESSRRAPPMSRIGTAPVLHLSSRPQAIVVCWPQRRD